VRIANDGQVYVCDRINDRIQVFTKQGKFIKEFFIRPVTQSPGTISMIAFSRDAGQEYLIVADPTNNMIWTLRRSDGEVLGSFGHDGRNAGQFHAVHSMTSDSAGNIYTGEVETGKRLQKFVLVK
jgi:sugar lactone lactonase YvrE